MLFGCLIVWSVLTCLETFLAHSVQCGLSCVRPYQQAGLGQLSFSKYRAGELQGSTTALWYSDSDAAPQRPGHWNLDTGRTAVSKPVRVQLQCWWKQQINKPRTNSSLAKCTVSCRVPWYLCTFLLSVTISWSGNNTGT